MTPDINLLAAENIANPYPVYESLRTFSPVYWDSITGSWLISRYSDVSAILHNDRFSSNRPMSNRGDLPEHMLDDLKPLDRLLSFWITFQDSPNHTRLRNIIGKAFSRRTSKLRSNIESIADDLISKMTTNRIHDLIVDIAGPLPAIVIAEIVGVPQKDTAEVRQWSKSLVTFFSSGRVTPQVAVSATRSILELTKYFEAAIRQKRIHLSDDFISDVLGTTSGYGLKDEDLIANCVALLFGGQETSTNLIGNGMLALLRNPHEMEKLRQDDSLLPRSIDELLRYDTPLQAVSRLAKEDLAIERSIIKRGDKVILLIGSAHRDSSRYFEPDRLDLRRQDNQHLSFGLGPHFCLGANLARLEAGVVIGALIRRFSELQIAEDKIQWRNQFAFRGLERLRLNYREA